MTSVEEKEEKAYTIQPLLVFLSPSDSITRKMTHVVSLTSPKISLMDNLSESR